MYASHSLCPRFKEKRMWKPYNTSYYIRTSNKNISQITSIKQLNFKQYDMDPSFHFRFSNEKNDYHNTIIAHVQNKTLIHYTFYHSIQNIRGTKETKAIKASTMTQQVTTIYNQVLCQSTKNISCSCSENSKITHKESGTVY